MVIVSCQLRYREKNHDYPNLANAALPPAQLHSTLGETLWNYRSRPYLLASIRQLWHVTPPKSGGLRSASLQGNDAGMEGASGAMSFVLPAKESSSRLPTK